MQSASGLTKEVRMKNIKAGQPVKIQFLKDVTVNSKKYSHTFRRLEMVDVTRFYPTLFGWKRGENGPTFLLKLDQASFTIVEVPKN